MKYSNHSCRMTAHISLYDLHSDYFIKSLDGFKDEDAHNRLQTQANHVAWLAGSIVHERFEMANLLGEKAVDDNAGFFEGNKGIQPGITYPTLESYKKNWNVISPVLRKIYVSIGDNKLDEAFEMMPGMTSTYYEMITYMIYREANIIGQIALYRRLLGYEALKYM